jgi:hypothetical protein
MLHVSKDMKGINITFGVSQLYTLKTSASFSSYQSLVLLSVMDAHSTQMQVTNAAKARVFKKLKA